MCVFKVSRVIAPDRHLLLLLKKKRESTKGKVFFPFFCFLFFKIITSCFPFEMMLLSVGYNRSDILETGVKKAYT